MASRLSTSDFLSRFDRVVHSYRRACVLQTVFWCLLVLLLTLGAVAAIDFVFEVSRDVRAVATSAILAIAIASLGWLSYRALVRTNDDSVAAKLESDFPELGQAIRTSVQFRKSVVGAGVSETLVAAMQHDLARRSQELPLHETVPSGKLYRAIALFGGAAAVLIILAVASWEWRTATLRTLFGDQPYTEIAVRPGDTRLDEGGTLLVTAEVNGRVGRPTMLFTRPLGGDETAWTSQELAQDNVTQQAPDHVIYQVALSNVQKPLEYRVAAGPYVTDTHRVAVRHPLSIEAVRVSLTPPAYTGLAPTVVEEGNVQAAAGSRAEITITLDRPAQEARLTLAPMRGRRVRTNEDASEEQAQSITLAVAGRTLTGQFELNQDVLYRVEGSAADGSRVRKNRYRIRVREDRPPRIAIDEPSGETEVHSLAEMIMRARVNDDYGLARAGIVFQINNGQEYPLIVRDIENETGADAEPPDEQPKAADEQQNVTRLQLDKLLPLEHFELTQKDSITYYAFAEDNPPGGPRRVQTDLQFIDIRPFRRLYRSVEGGRGGGGGGGGGPQLASLEELISRERVVLNRTLRLARSSQPGQRENLDDVDQIIPLQQVTAELTRELADAVAEFEKEEGLTDERVSDLFYSAEEAMLAAMDSLTVGNFDTAALQEQDALRYLVEGRNAIEVAIGSAGGGGLARLFQANRRLLQKLRRPTSDIEKANEAARMLRNLAQREEEVYDSLATMLRESMQAADASADAEAQPDDRRQRRELEKKQLDISLDAERVDEVVQAIESMTELTRARSTKSTEMASKVTGALEQGNTDNAAEGAQVAGDLFRELAVQIEGVTALEPVGRIAVARDLASRMAVDSRTSQSDLAKMAQSPAPMSAEAKKEMDSRQSEMATTLTRRKAQWSDTTATIEDVLKSIVQTYSAEQDDAVGRIERLLAEAQFSQVTDQLGRLENTVGDRDWRTAELELEALADRMDDLAQRLDTIHRSLVAPRIEQLRAFEATAVELLKTLSLLTGEEQITRWHRKADSLLEDMASAEVQLAAMDRLRETMQAGGWKDAPPSRWNWSAGENSLRIAPGEHVAATQALVSDIQRYIQELVVGGIYAADADAVPPQYIPLVRRYLEALSKDGGD